MRSECADELLRLSSLYDCSSHALLQGPALGAAVAALGLSNKAVYADQMQDSNGGVSSGMESGNYTDGPDLAPNAMPAAVSGMLPGLFCSACCYCSNSDFDIHHFEPWSPIQV